MHRGCERSVITYSSLISACERAGQWELALELFQEMVRWSWWASGLRLGLG
jgi:pentatricopeptide repeat domain-containing protein 1